jgi:hypothetical protein
MRVQTLGHSQKPVVMPHYPHMLPKDRRIWTRFLESGIVIIDEVWYDIHVGRGVDIPETANEMTRAIRDAITRKRIDVVARIGEEYWVIEVKPRADMYALGQVQTYVRLFTAEFRVFQQTQPVIICDEVDEDVVYLFEEFDVKVFQTGWQVGNS